MAMATTTAQQPAAAAAAAAGAGGAAPAAPKPSDQIDGDLSDWIRNFDAMIPSGSHANFARAWGGVGEHEMYKKMAVAVQQVAGKLAVAAKVNDAIADELKAHANKAYGDRKFNAAVAMYTRALMYAASGKTAAVLACNRAAVMIEQGLPLAALADAHYAVTADPTYAKAVQRRGRCLETLRHSELAAADLAASSSGGDATSNTGGRADDAAVGQILERAMRDLPTEEDGLASLGGDASSPATLTSSSPLVATAVWERGPTHEEKGAHVRANAAAAPATTLLVELPIASVVRTEGLLCSCAHCHRQTTCLYPGREWMENGLRSRGLFCGASCASAHWAAYGDREAGHPFWLACPVDLLLAFRLLRSCDRDPALKQRYAELREWTKELNPGATVGGHETAAVCAAVAFGAVDSLRGDTYVTAMRKLLANATPITFTDRVSPDGASAASAQQHSFVKLTIGKGVYPQASLLNHSCDPNVFASFKGNPYRASRELHLRLIRPVMEGEELCVAYDGLTAHTNHSTRARIRDLRAKYGFACTCSACFNNVDEPIPQGEQEHYVKAADYYQKGRRLMREGNARDAVDVLSQSLEIVMRHVCPPPRKPQFVISKTHDAIAQAHQMLGHKARCITHVELAIATMATLQGEEHVDLAREYSKLSTLCAAATESEVPGAKAKAEAAASKAATILRLHFPRSNALEAEIALLMGDLRLPPEVSRTDAVPAS